MPRWRRHLESRRKLLDDLTTEINNAGDDSEKLFTVFQKLDSLEQTASQPWNEIDKFVEYVFDNGSN